MVFNTLLYVAVLVTLGTAAGIPEQRPQPQPQPQPHMDPSQLQIQKKATVEDVHYQLYTRKNPDEAQEVIYQDRDSLVSSSLDPNDATLVLIHGFGGCCSWPIQAKDELLKFGSYNVLVVNWSKLSAQPWYNTAYSSVPLVAERTARVLEWMQAESGLDVSKLQITGHSLGAHMAGGIGQNLTTFTLPYITGLDPAGPWFHGVHDSRRLDDTDAEFVMIIHTNGGSIPKGCVGMKDTMGDVDLYPNGGVHQPGCTVGGNWGDLLVGGCSHSRACDLWIESINSNTEFTSRPCDSWEAYQDGVCSDCGQGCTNMGFHADTSLRGSYFLSTAKESPFALG